MTPSRRRPTLHDCRTLEGVLHPKIEALRAQHGALRASWETADIFGAERFRRDLGGLDARWKDAQRALARVRQGRRASLTPAEPAYDRLVRAVRQGGATAPLRRGDLAELTRRLHRRAGSFGFDLAEVWNSNPAVSAWNDFQAYTGHVKNLRDCSDLIRAFSVAMPDTRNAFTSLEPAWRSLSPADVDAFARDLESVENAWKAAVDRVQPMLDEYGPSDTTAAQDEWDGLNKAAALVVPLTARLARARADIARAGALPPALHFRPIPQPTRDARDDFMHATDPKAPDAAWYIAPWKNPWILGGLAVGSLGVVAWTLTEVRALLPASSR